MKKFKYILICIAVFVIFIALFIYSKTKVNNNENLEVAKESFTNSEMESLTHLNNPNNQLGLKLSTIDKKVEEIKEKEKFKYYTGVSDEGVLQFKNVFYYVDDETNTHFDFYYDELGKLIFAEITHYKGPLYSMYIENDGLLYTEVGSFSQDSDVFVEGGLEAVNEAIAKDERYSFILEDVDLCLKYAYEPVVMVSQYGETENEDLTEYSVEILAYNQNLSYIEYPQIVGLEDKVKEEKINKILEEQVVKGAKSYLDENFVDFDVVGVSYSYVTTVGLCNNDIASFNYHFYAWDNIGIDTFGTQGYTSRSYGVTIDMNKGEKIELWELLTIDERLIESDDGTGIETDYNAEWPQFYNFKGAFEIRDSEETEDIYHHYSYEETIENLKDPNGETNWYIDSDKNLEFSPINFVEIPYTEIKEIIFPKYLDALQE